MAKEKQTLKAPLETTKLEPKEELVNLLKAKVAGLFEREPQSGMSDSALAKLVDEILELVD